MSRSDLWTAREIFLLKSLSAKGVSDALIASRVRRSKDAVRFKQREIGLRGQREKIDRPPILGAGPKKNVRITTVRPCMNVECRKPIRSEGFHHRHCEACRRKSAGPYDL